MSIRQPYPKDYATLIPVLVGLAQIFHPRRVLEYGAGMYSTPLFLNLAVFPSIERLTSCETNRDWVRKIQNIELVGGDERLLWWYDNSARPDDDENDLVLVDSESETGKIEIIKKCGLMREGLVIIHDTDHGPYAEAVRNSFKRFVMFDGHNPWTTIAWNREEFSELIIELLCTMREKIKQYAHVDPTDVAQWIQIFQETK
jgi:predicted O-methyltransferase YrrM